MVVACLSDPQKGMRWSVVLIKPRTFLISVATVTTKALAGQDCCLNPYQQENAVGALGRTGHTPYGRVNPVPPGPIALKCRRWHACRGADASQLQPSQSYP